MCNTDSCDDSRREFLVGAAGAVVGLMVSGAAGQTKYPHDQQVVTRFLDNPAITTK